MRVVSSMLAVTNAANNVSLISVVDR